MSTLPWMAPDRVSSQRSSIGADFGGHVGEERDALRHGGSEGSAPVLLQVPVRRADLRQEPLHPLMVVEDLAVEMAGIPIEQDVADVEDDDAGAGQHSTRPR